MAFKISLHIILEPDGDKWSAHCPELLEQGASTFGDTPQEAFRGIFEVLNLVVASLGEHGI